MGSRSRDTTPYTYRYLHNGRPAEIHSENLEDLMNRAVDHLRRGVVSPVHIRQGKGRVLLDTEDLVDLWASRAL